MKWINLFIMLLLLTGCSSGQQVVYKTIYQEVKVPVVYKIAKPERPIYTEQDNAPNYILKLKHYILLLETIVDEHNKD